MNSQPIATIEAPLSGEKVWVARITRLDPQWTFGRDQLPPLAFPSRIVFWITKPGIYEHRNTSHGSGFVYIDHNGRSEPMSKQDVIKALE